MLNYLKKMLKNRENDKNHRNYQTLFKLIIVKNCDTNILFTSVYTHDHFTYFSSKEFVRFFYEETKYQHGH